MNSLVRDFDPWPFEAAARKTERGMFLGAPQKNDHTKRVTLKLESVLFWGTPCWICLNGSSIENTHCGACIISKQAHLKMSVSPFSVLWLKQLNLGKTSNIGFTLVSRTKEITPLGLAPH